MTAGSCDVAIFAAVAQLPHGVLLPESEDGAGWRRNYANQEEAHRDVADYLMTFYNQKRLHSALGEISLAEFERQHQLKPAPALA